MGRGKSIKKYIFSRLKLRGKSEISLLLKRPIKVIENSHCGLDRGRIGEGVAMIFPRRFTFLRYFDVVEHSFQFLRENVSRTSLENQQKKNRQKKAKEGTTKETNLQLSNETSFGIFVELFGEQSLTQGATE